MTPIPALSVIPADSRARRTVALILLGAILGAAPMYALLVQRQDEAERVLAETRAAQQVRISGLAIQWANGSKSIVAIREAE